jgi:hypothetical protein
MIDAQEHAAFQGLPEWAYLGLNQGPPACEAGALPLSYTPGKRPGMLADERCGAARHDGVGGIRTLETG